MKKFKTDYFGLVSKVIESAEDNTAGIVLNKSAIKKVFADMDNMICLPLEHYETQRGYLVKEADFTYAIKLQWKEDVENGK